MPFGDQARSFSLTDLLDHIVVTPRQSYDRSAVCRHKSSLIARESRLLPSVHNFLVQPILAQGFFYTLALVGILLTPTLSSPQRLVFVLVIKLSKHSQH